MYRLICQKPAHFLSAQMALVITFFQMFIVLGMYNFAFGYNETQNVKLYRPTRQVVSTLHNFAMWLKPL